MSVEGFAEIANTIYVAKELYDMGKYELVKSDFYDVLDCDAYYDNMYGLIPSIFKYYYCKYYENRGLELHILSDPAMVDFFVMAGEYGKRNSIPDKDNPYIKEAEQETYDNLCFNYCLDWKLEWYTKPKRPYHSRLALFISIDDYVDLGVLVVRLISLYKWFTNKCNELRIKLGCNNL